MSKSVQLRQHLSTRLRPTWRDMEMHNFRSRVWSCGGETTPLQGTGTGSRVAKTMWKEDEEESVAVLGDRLSEFQLAAFFALSVFSRRAGA